MIWLRNIRISPLCKPGKLPYQGVQGHKQPWRIRVSLEQLSRGRNPSSRMKDYIVEIRRARSVCKSTTTHGRVV